MILATHALTGAVIGKNIESPWLVIILSLALHYILDNFRHGEYLNRDSKWKDFWKVSIDLLAGAVIIYSIVTFQNVPVSARINILIGSFFSVLPDFFTLAYWKLGIKFLRPLYEFHFWVHRYPLFAKEREWNLRNAVNDAIISAIAVILLII